VRPEIEWRAVPGARSYRIQLESRVPEGRVIERVDTSVADNRFIPPRPLADRRAAVKVLVTADCANAPAIAAQAAWFFIDAAPTCPAPQKLVAMDRSAEWSAVPGATSYELEVYALPDGRLLLRRDTPLTTATLPADSSSKLIAVRSHCASVVGDAVYRTFPEPR
jgi:hypothetical protein